jgi:hypothetical protein
VKTNSNDINAFQCVFPVKHAGVSRRGVFCFPVARRGIGPRSLHASCDGYEPCEDARASYDFGRRCQREMGIRAGDIQPLPNRPHEVHWASAGPVPISHLDTVVYG